VGEEARATLEDLLPHDGRRAQVELTVEVGETRLEIRRTLTRERGVKQQARLLVRRAGAPPEKEINGPAPVNARILQELGGLDGEALRNSCFMEQKALDRIELLARGQREAAVAKLLGLERLRRVERELKEAHDEQSRQVTRLRAEGDLAALQQAMCEAEA